MESKASEQGKIANTMPGEGHDGIPTQESITVSQPKQFKVISYNCKNIETALWTFEALSKIADIFLVQEHWLFDCQLQKLASMCENLTGCRKSVDTGNPILPIQMPRGYGGTAILSKKDIDHLITRLPDGGNRIQCIEMACKDPMVIFSVYMPCKGQ